MDTCAASDLFDLRFGEPGSLEADDGQLKHKVFAEMLAGELDRWRNGLQPTSHGIVFVKRNKAPKLLRRRDDRPVAPRTDGEPGQTDRRDQHNNQDRAQAEHPPPPYFVTQLLDEGEESKAHG